MRGSEILSIVPAGGTTPPTKRVRSATAPRAKQLAMRNTTQLRVSSEMASIIKAVKRAPTDPQTVLDRCQEAANRFPASVL